MSQHYKKLRWSKLLKDKPVKDAIDANKRRVLFEIKSGKGTNVFFRIMDNLFKNQKNNEYIYLDRKRESLIRTSIHAGESLAFITETDIKEWIEVYEAYMRKHDIRVKENRKKAVKKREKTVKRNK